ncbi:hypothetical protein [Methylobacterium soli]|uniref:Uncharacterized protein n=1 Tax=Methylobacterium soli TaxID=553447 RepID=A0A6L3SZG2_9HYPH|nr:hypothetical protein [Methylobacterium soli]KAB1075895.1 hypothetical protein F6X53_23990 [Methylobacterium soli]GJE46225.1 hypothetical protein AEGHOMDF_5425 [Methylobacterium soli]
MAIMTTSTPASAGERARLRKSQQGPVTLAVATMRRADPDRLSPTALRDRLYNRLTAFLMTVERA